MTNEFARSPLRANLTKASLRLATATVLVGMLAACSTMESLDPTGLLGGDTGQTFDGGGLSQTDAPQDTGPDVAAIPDRPKPVAGAEDSAQVATALQADAANVQYSAESLRGGTEAAAAAPQAPSAEPTQVAELAAPAARTQAPPVSAPASQPRTAEDYAEAPAQPDAAAPPPAAAREAEPAPVAEPTAQAEPAAPEEPAQIASAPLTEAPPQPAPAAPPPDPSAADVAAIPAEQPVPQAEAQAEPQPEPQAAPEPAAPPSPAAMAEAPPQPAATPSPDAVPAAEPVPPPTQVAAAAPTGPVPGAQAPVTRRAAPGFAPSNAPPLDPTVSNFVAAPVVARYRQTAALQASVYPDSTPNPGYYGQATATIHFPDNTTILNASARQQVRAAAELFKSHGSRGFVRVVGYASQTGGNLAPSRLMQINFEKSQARATTIARALMKEGVPANKVLVDSAAQTSANAKADIFVQS